MFLLIINVLSVVALPLALFLISMMLRRRNYRNETYGPVSCFWIIAIPYILYEITDIFQGIGWYKAVDILFPLRESFNMLFMPFLFFCLRKVLKKDTELHSVQMLHLLPFLLSLTIYCLNIGFAHNVNGAIFIMQLIGYPLLLRHCLKVDKSGTQEAAPKEDFAQLRDYARVVAEYLQNTELYTDADLSLKDVAKATGISTNNLSKSINLVYGKNFVAFVNGFRIEKSKSLLLVKKELGLTLETIAEQCGFNSQVVYCNVFKRIVGCTTIQWLKSNKEINP